VHIQAMGSVFLLCSFIIATTMLQQRAVTESKGLLDTTTDEVKPTALYKSALLYMNRRYDAVMTFFYNPTFIIPISFLVVVVLFCSIVTYFGAEALSKAHTASYVLGGALAADPTADPARLAQFQSGTVFIGSMAFLGAYVWLISNLVTRINNYDTSPITFYFLSVRILAACLVAGLARQIVEGLPYHEILYNSNNEPVGLGVLGFLIGWNPSLWTTELVQRGSSLWKLGTARQQSPKEEDMPQSMTLAMIQGLVDDKVSRLSELDVDNCRKLACENPVVIWLRTPYNLELSVDWIAQAQLCVLYDPDNIQALRRTGIRDIFIYYDEIRDPNALGSVQKIVDAPQAIIERHETALGESPTFQKLAELRRAWSISETPRVARKAPTGTAQGAGGARQADRNGRPDPSLQNQGPSGQSVGDAKMVA
jgi:hypothetical protein